MPVFLVLASTLAAQSETGTLPFAESGAFLLYKFEQPIGQETYNVTRTEARLDRGDRCAQHVR